MMELIARLIEGALDYDELNPEEVREVEVEQCFSNLSTVIDAPFSALSVWQVSLLLSDTAERYAFFDLCGVHPYEPYTVVSPLTDGEFIVLYGLQEAN